MMADEGRGIEAAIQVQQSERRLVLRRPQRLGHHVSLTLLQMHSHVKRQLQRKSVNHEDLIVIQPRQSLSQSDIEKTKQKPRKCPALFRVRVRACV